MLSSLSSITATRITPATAAPIAASVNPESKENRDTSEKTDNPNTDQTRSTNPRAAIVQQLDPAEQRVLEKLKSRDREVRAHEQAHLSAAGNLASSGASFTYQKGPDGQRYAIGGEVGIESARVADDPQATLQRAQQIRRAALAPANPSAQDRSVAANASAIALEAQAEIAQLKQTGQDQYTENQNQQSTETDKTTKIDTFA